MDAATTSGRAVDCDPVPVRDEGYVDALVRASLHLIRKDFPHEVRGHGVRLLQHLMRFRWEEVSIINWSKFADVFSLLGVELGVLDDLVWKNAAADLVAEVVWSHGISLLHDLIPCLVCLSAKRATELLEKHVGAVLGEKEKCQVEVAEEHASVVKAVLDAAITYAGWAHVVDLGKHGLIKGKRPVSIAVADHDFAGNDGARRSNSFHHVGCLLLAEQNLISEAFLIVSSWSRIQQYKEVLTCILSPLSKIWTQPEWESKYTHYAWYLTCLFSNRQFVKNVHDVVKSWEGQLKRRAEESHAIQMPDKYSVSLLGLILPLLLRYLQCVHALWNREITFDLSKKLAKAKRFGIDEEEGFQEIEMRQWLQDIRESGYLLLNDCLGRLRMSLFGYLVDGEAATKAIPFCRALIHLAGAANDDKLRDLVKEQKEIEDAADSFTCWLVKQKEDLHAKACSAPPKEFFGQTQLEWNWEFEDEFRRYLPVYFDTMQEVDAMVDCLEGSDHYYEIVERIGEKIEIPSRIFDRDDAKKSIRVLLQILHFWEPQFHPLIREGHKDFLLDIARWLAKAKATEYSEPLIPQMEDFLPHLQPYAFAFIVATLKDPMYDNAKVQVQLHKEFDNYLSSGELDGHLQSMKGIYSELPSSTVPTPFSTLQKDLIDLSLKRRIEIVGIHHQVLTYSKCLRCLLENESLKDDLRSLMSELEAEGFFDVNDKHIDWGKKCFSELVDKFNVKVFAGHSLPRHYVIRGIMDYWTILSWKGSNWEDTFDKLWSDTRYYNHQYHDITTREF
uniref:Exportin-5 C-terminal domain-containing protein n=1 Tax=Oryza barthii TaxID=65489 RepID=A0A0D3HMC3_9ORYZ